MIENCRVNECEKRLLVSAIQEIIRCNDDFRSGMPKDWEGDLLQDAVDTARFLLVRIGAAVGNAQPSPVELPQAQNTSPNSTPRDRVI